MVSPNIISWGILAKFGLEENHPLKKEKYI